MLKRLVFAMLILWALGDGVISARQAPSLSVGVVLFFASLMWSGLFILLIAVIWNWVAKRFGPRSPQKPYYEWDESTRSFRSGSIEEHSEDSG